MRQQAFIHGGKSAALGGFVERNEMEDEEAPNQTHCLLGTVLFSGYVLKTADRTGCEHIH